MVDVFESKSKLFSYFISFQSYCLSIIQIKYSLVVANHLENTISSRKKFYLQKDCIKTTQSFDSWETDLDLKVPHNHQKYDANVIYI